MAIKRNHIRILVALRVRAESPTGKVHALTKNLSVGGVFLLTDARWPVSTPVGLVLEHKGVHVEVRAEVTHVREDGLGLQFVDPSPLAVTELIGVIDDILSSGVDLDGGHELLQIDERLVLFRRGVLEYSGRLAGWDGAHATVETAESLRDGEALVVLLPSRSEGAHIRAIVGSFAQVTSTTSEGFGLQFIDPSAEFVQALERVGQ